jgi:proteasome lid subunit RPN8/RPN11
MTLHITENQLRKLHLHAQEGYPHEVVGILAGSRSHNTVRQVVPLHNERSDSPANRYQVSGLVLMRAEEALEAEGLEVVGYYHSHPDHGAAYSEYDRDHALPNMSYVITAVRAGEVSETLSWRLDEDRSSMLAEPISIED